MKETTKAEPFVAFRYLLGSKGI